jgi:hypothetical protein
MKHRRDNGEQEDGTAGEIREWLSAERTVFGRAKERNEPSDPGISRITARRKRASSTKRDDTSQARVHAHARGIKAEFVQSLL